MPATGVVAVAFFYFSSLLQRALLALLPPVDMRSLSRLFDRVAGGRPATFIANGSKCAIKAPTDRIESSSAFMAFASSLALSGRCCSMYVNRRCRCVHKVLLMISEMLRMRHSVFPAHATTRALEESRVRLHTVRVAAATSEGRSRHICMCSVMTVIESRASKTARAGPFSSALRFSRRSYALESTDSWFAPRSHCRIVRNNA